MSDYRSPDLQMKCHLLKVNVIKVKNRGSNISAACKFSQLCYVSSLNQRQTSTDIPVRTFVLCSVATDE